MSLDAVKQKGARVQALVAADTLGVPRSELLWMASETFSYLSRLSREVREGKNVLLASQFARWLEFSGLLKVFDRLPGGGDVRALNHALIQDCGEMFRSGRADPRYATSDIAEINRKLDLLLTVDDGAVRRGHVQVIEAGVVGQGNGHDLLPGPSAETPRK